MYEKVSEPLKSAAGTYVTEPSTRSTDPLEAEPTLTTDNTSPSTSVSLTNTPIVTAVSSTVDTESSFATGPSFTAPTVTVTVAESVRSPSQTVYEKVSEPKKSRWGTYVNEPSTPRSTVPYNAPPSSMTISTSPSGSKSLASTPPAVTVTRPARFANLTSPMPLTSIKSSTDSNCPCVSR